MSEPHKTLAELAAEQGVIPVQNLDELAAPPERRLTDSEWDAWQAAINGRNETIGDKYAKDSPYARLKAYADGNGPAPSPKDIHELLHAFNATSAMNGVAKRTADNHRRRAAALAALADTDLLIDPEALRRALAVGTRNEHAASHPSTATLRARIAELETQLEDARDAPDPATVYGGDLTPPLCCCKRGLMCGACGCGDHWQCPDRDDQDDEYETDDAEGDR